MPVRLRVTYSILLQQLKNVVHTARGADLDPSTIQTDFEFPAIQALETAFPNSHLRGYLFHYSQCTLRMIQTIGLVGHYRENPAVQNVVRRPASLPLLTLDLVQDACIETLDERPRHPPRTRLL